MFAGKWPIGLVVLLAIARVGDAAETTDAAQSAPSPGAAAEPEKAQVPAPAPVAPTPLDISPAEFMQMPDSWAREELRKHQRVAIGGFRVAFVTKAVASDSIRAAYHGGGQHSSGVNTKLEVTLRQVDAARMQALADRAYREFLEQLKQAGVEVIPHETVAAHPAFGEMKYAKHAAGAPYVLDQGGRTYTFFTPAGMKLWFTQAEPLGDQGAFGTGNGWAVGEFAFQQKAVVLNPMLVVDFAETHSGRPRGFFNVRLGNRTEVGVKTGISLRSGRAMTQLAFIARSAPIATAIASGTAFLKETITIAGSFGEMVKREESSNRGLVTGLAVLGLSGGPVRESERHDLVAVPDRYDELAGAALQAGTRLLARTFTAIRSN